MGSGFVKLGFMAAHYTPKAAFKPVAYIKIY